MLNKIIKVCFLDDFFFFVFKIIKYEIFVVLVLFKVLRKG